MVLSSNREDIFRCAARTRCGLRRVPNPLMCGTSLTSLSTRVVAIIPSVWTIAILLGRGLAGNDGRFSVAATPSGSAQSP
jgi:hypothetical protein